MSGGRPKETVADVTRSLTENYGMKALTVTELVSYDCQNFAVEVAALPTSCADNRTLESGDRVDRSAQGQKTKHCVGETESGFGCIAERNRNSDSNISNGTSGECTENELVLKVFSGAHCMATRLPTTRQQVECSQFLRSRGFLCPRVIRTRRGEMFGSTTSGFQSCTLLMTRLKGQQLGADQSRITSRVLFEVGALLAHLHLTLQEADSQCLETDPNNPWGIENLHLLSDYLHCIQDEEERLMLDEIISNFKEIRQNRFHTLQKGIIHGDFHDLNIIVDWEHFDPAPLTTQPSTLQSPPIPPPHCQSRSKLLQKYGIIDFEEMSVSYPALELSRLIADMMLDCRQVSPLKVGGHVLAGYMSVDSQPVGQFGQCFYDAVKACLAQYIVLSVYDYHRQGESNDYCLVSTQEAKAMLKTLKTVDCNDVLLSWGEVLTGYGLDNPFIL